MLFKPCFSASPTAGTMPLLLNMVYYLIFMGVPFHTTFIDYSIPMLSKEVINLALTIFLGQSYEKGILQS